MNKIYLLISVFLFAFAGCNDRWDKFYGEEEDDRSAGATSSMYEVLTAHPDRYSKFMELLKKTGRENLLTGNRTLTLWVPHNDYMTDEIMNLDSAGMQRFVLNHFNNLAMYRTKLSTKNELRTLAGKYLEISRSLNGYSIEQMPVIAYDMACKNGVIHEIEGILVPIKNLVEYINESGPDFSVLRDSLWAYNDTIFERELSYPIGVDSVGQTIYDSVFTIKNTLLKSVDPGNEKSSYTLFLPSNEVIEKMLSDTREYFSAIERDFVLEDSLKCFQWVWKATFVYGQIENLNNVKVLTAVGGSELRFNKQIVQTDYEACSNGVVYKFEKLYMPRNGYLEKVDFYPPNLLDVPAEEQPFYYRISDGGLLRRHEDKGVIFLDADLAKDENDWVELKTLSKDKYANILPALMMPGKYKLSGQFYGYRGADTRIFVNGVPQTFQKTGVNYFKTGQSGDASDLFEYTKTVSMCDTVVIKEQAGYNMVTIRLENTNAGSTKDRIRVRRLLFEPLKDNY